MKMSHTLPNSADQRGLVKNFRDGAPGRVRHLVFWLAVMSLPAMGQTSFWTSATTPQVSAVSDSKSVTLGLKFYSDTTGYVTGLRFYKGTQNAGMHIGTLWSGGGAA